MLFTLLGCPTLDVVPIVEGPHCASDAIGYVVATLDGDTIDVVTTAELSVSEGDTAVNDTGGGGDSGGTSSGTSEDTRVLRIRMLGVDAPEISHDSTEVADCYGDEASAWTRTTLLGRQVALSFDRTCNDTYGRALAYVFLTDDGANYDLEECLSDSCTVPEDSAATGVVLVNDIVIRYGYARVYEDFDDIRLAELLYSAQSAAQAGNRGLWSSCE